ncbi:hypothetical protein HK104_001650, partial [Borealophlyctis nickersoniae]
MSQENLPPSNPLPPTPSSTSSPSPSLEKYRVIAHYDPQHHDEIGLTIGDLVLILHEYDDGWVLGQNETSNSIGLLPRNFLELLSTSKQSESPTSPTSSITATPDALKRTSSFMHSSMGKMNIVNEPLPTSPSTSSPTSTRPPSVVGSVRSVGPAASVHSVGPVSVSASTSSSQPASTRVRAPLTIVAKAALTPEQEKERCEAAKLKLAMVREHRMRRAMTAQEIGCFKVAVAGDSGIGKTSLIQNFMSMPEITDAETLTPESSEHIRIVHASTLPVMLGKEPTRNLTFVDTPGFGVQMDALATITPIVDYHENQFAETSMFFGSKTPIPQLTRFLATPSGAHTHVDVCIFGILHRLKPVDIEFMRRLTPFVNIIPVIVKCDTMKPQELFALKVSVLEGLVKAGIPIYGFGLDMGELIDLAKAGVGGAMPFAISNHEGVGATRSDPPSTPTTHLGARNEFAELRSTIFYTHIADLRYLTAEKFAKWRDQKLKSEASKRDKEVAAMKAKAEEEALARQRDRDRDAAAQHHHHHPVTVSQPTITVPPQRQPTKHKVLATLFKNSSTTSLHNPALYSTGTGAAGSGSGSGLHSHNGSAVPTHGILKKGSVAS